MRKISLVLLAVSFGLTAGVANAQTSTSTLIPQPPQVVNVNPTDLFNDVVGGVGRAQNVYATASKIAGSPGYHFFGTITTDPAYTVPNGVTNLFAHAAGTISTVTITTEPNPTDGRRECWWLDQTTTTLAWTANTGQTIGANVVGSGTSKVANCITYDAAASTWYSSP